MSGGGYGVPCERRKGKAGEVCSEDAGTVSGEDDAEESEPCRCAARRRLELQA